MHPLAPPPGAHGHQNGSVFTLIWFRFVRDEGFTSGRGDRQDVRNVMVIITDGNSANTQETVRQATLAKRSGIHIITVGQCPVFTSSQRVSARYSHHHSGSMPRIHIITVLVASVPSTLVCMTIDLCEPCETRWILCRYRRLDERD